jgi:hypothetical protein
MEMRIRSSMWVPARMGAKQAGRSVVMQEGMVSTAEEGDGKPSGRR